jgi:CcmD family protein
MNKLKSFFLVLFALSTPALFAQDNGVEMADAMYQSGKIYVVVGVLSIIFIGIIVYLVLLDRKINKLEKSQKH